MGAGASLYVRRNVSYRDASVGLARARLLVVAVLGGLDLFYAEVSRPGTGNYRPAAAVDEGCLIKHGVALAE